MNKERITQLELHGAELTAEEKAEGWFFCNCEWDGMLLHERDDEAKLCYCHLRKLNNE